MFVVLFEVHPAPGKKDEYLTLAKQLKPLLEAIEGFVDNERFESASRDGWVLSLSTWRDEKALVRLWQEKRGEVGPEDLSTNLIVQLGLVTEDLNRQWYERNTGNAI